MSFTGPDRQINLATLKDELATDPASLGYAGKTADEKRDLYNGQTQDGPVPVWVIKNYIDRNTHGIQSGTAFQIGENVRRLADREDPGAQGQKVATQSAETYEQQVASARTWVNLVLEADPQRQDANVIDLETGQPVKILADLTAADCLSTTQRDEIIALKDALTDEELGYQLRVGETRPGRRSRAQIRGTGRATTKDVLDAEALP